MLTAALAAPAAFADGDPASDVLYAHNVFLPAPPPQATGATALQAQVAAVYRHGDRIRVAVIATPSDLGSIPSLFGHPSDYARFLGLEIRPYFIGPLLVVMPAGFGIYDGGRSTAAEEKVLSRLTVQGTSADDLTNAAANAVGRLLAAGALCSKDILAPLAEAFSGLGSRGHPVALHYVVFEDSGRSSVAIQVIAGVRVLATFSLPLRAVVGDKVYSVDWRAPAKPPAGPLQFCVRATDPSGNRGPSSCAPISLA
ncbi:MAG: hypothetical protein ACXVZ3_13255 [Gaiellaceae bacterium]